jgi:hypothetical protein
MDFYKVCLPKANYWNDDFESWIENSYSKGNANYNLDYYDEDDKHGIIGNPSMIEDIPILISGETENFID